MSGTDAGQMRVSDAERDRVAARLVAAHGEGRLSLAEFDERVLAAHGAVVRAHLEPLVADLPPSAGAETAGAGSQAVRELVRPARPMPFMPPVPFVGPCSRRGAVATWAVVSLINLVIWVAVVAGTGTFVAPWWIWVAGPWGVVLLLGAGLRRATGVTTGALPGR